MVREVELVGESCEVFVRLVIVSLLFLTVKVVR